MAYRELPQVKKALSARETTSSERIDNKTLNSTSVDISFSKLTD